MSGLKLKALAYNTPDSRPLVFRSPDHAAE
jgi:hypothetical protein